MVSPSTSSAGVYTVKESGLDFQHSSQDPDVPVSPQEFLDTFRNKFEMRVLEQPNQHELVFEMKHVDCSFVNALRRILLAEVPTVALEHVYMWNNSSIIHDEVLAHRLGLVPLNVDARLFDEILPDEEDEDGGGGPTDRNTVVFRLAVSCPKKKPRDEENNGSGGGGASSSQQEADADMDLQHVAAADGDADARAAAAAADQVAAGTRRLEFPSDRPYTKHVYSSDLEWVPQGDQRERFPDGIAPIHSDILLAKLRPGQSIELEAHGRRGIGKDHAKFSPVATASYRLMPEIKILHDIYDEAAEELVHVYEPGVFQLVPTDAGDPPETRCKAVVANPYACTMSRNYMRHPVLAKSIQMSRIVDHFIFSVESVGTYRPAVLVAEALRTLQAKCHKLMDHIDESQARAASSS